MSALGRFQRSQAVARAQKALNGFPGEVNYPNCSFSRAPPGKPAYERLLLRSRLRAGLALDKSANYLGGVDCAAKLKRRYPRAKVVASVCNVASRLWSRMNHVNRDRKKDEADLSKTVDWPKHVVDVTRAQLAKLDAFGWENHAEACRTGHATHVCKVLATSKWGTQVLRFRDAFGDNFKVFLMEELLTLEGPEIRARLAPFLGVPAPDTSKGIAKHPVVHSNAAYRNYKQERGDANFDALSRLLAPIYANDTATLAALLPGTPIADLWRRSVRPTGAKKGS